MKVHKVDEVALTGYIAEKLSIPRVFLRIQAYKDLLEFGMIRFFWWGLKHFVKYSKNSIANVHDQEPLHTQ